MSLITFLAGVLILFIILKILALPMKLIIKFVINAVIGGMDNYAYCGIFRNSWCNYCSNFTICISYILKKFIASKT